VAGLLVLGAIVGALVGIDRLLGEGDLGPLDGRRPEVGEPAPLFALRDAGGVVRRLDGYRGRAVWLNFWATTCGPCRRELPDIQRLADEVGDERLAVLAVNQQESADRATGFFDEIGVDLPILLDSSGEVSRQYRLQGLPYNFFIDRDGVLRSFKAGFLTEDEMRERLAEVGLATAG
jgi:thiol-disulfide isomerase/thioredoxin